MQTGSSEGCEGRLFCAFPLASDVLLAVFGVAWLSEAARRPLASFPCGILYVCVSVSRFPLFIRRPVILD